jgi:nucleotide-binding universal stress UspA family protein
MAGDRYGERELADRNHPFVRKGLRLRSPFVMVVAVEPGEGDHVIMTALAYARLFPEALVCFVYANRKADRGSEFAGTTRIEVPDDQWAQPTRDLRDRVLGAARDAEVNAQFHRLAGNPAHEIARFAFDHDAQMIVMGTRKPGPVSQIQEKLRGSVMTALSQAQSVPLLVVPDPQASSRNSHLG